MKSVAFSQFRSHASGLFSAVEKGETILVLRHGRPVAEIVPVRKPDGALPAWKRPGLRLARKGADLSRAILEDRAE